MFSGVYAEDFDRWSDFYDSSPEMKLLNDAAVTGAVLEVGVGTGRIASRLAPQATEYVAVDVDTRLLPYCQDRDIDAAFLAQDGQQLGFAPASFNTIIDGWTFSSYDTPEQAAAEYKRVLRPEGVLRVIREDTGSEYEGVLQQFVPAADTYTVEHCVDDVLTETFGQPQQVQQIVSSYVFDSAAAAYEAFRFHLEEWMDLQLTTPQKDELHALLNEDSDGRVRIGEKAVFMEFTA